MDETRSFVKLALHSSMIDYLPSSHPPELASRASLRHGQARGDADRDRHDDVRLLAVGRESPKVSAWMTQVTLMTRMPADLGS
jgi:hypothetical protein